MLSKIKRPLLAMVLVMGVGVASAVDYCNSVAPVQPCPVAVTYQSPCALPRVATTMMPASVVAQTMPLTQIGGYSVTPTVASSSTMPAVTNQITYIVPSISGTLETTSIPTGDNDVERWYATPRTDGNQVGMY